MVKHGSAPYLECSTRGDRRFSAFCARIRGRGGKSIEEIYLAAKVFANGPTGRAVNAAEVRALYSQLWDEYIAENPELLDVLRAASGLSDMFGRPGGDCPATELWRIRRQHLGSGC
jgi:hypothetical protein